MTTRLMTAEQVAETLLPCPFCGGKPYIIENDSHGGCGIGCHCDPEPYVDALVGHLDKCAEMWNTRHG